MPDPFAEPVERGPDLAFAVGGVMALLGFLVGARPLADNSFLTHLATGRLILDTGAVPTVDSYSLVSAGEPWTVQSWLVSLIYGLLEAGPGLWAIRILHGTLGLAVVAGVWRLTASARSLVLRAALTGSVLVIGTFLWSPRPLLVALVGFVVVLLVLEGRLHPGWLLPVFWVWVNSHGTFVLGAGLVAVHTMGRIIDCRLDGHRPGFSGKEVRVVVWTAVGVVSGALGPLGPRLLWFPVALMGRNEALHNVAEWRSPSFRSPVEVLFLLLLPVLVVAAGRGAPWRALLPSILFFAAGLMAVRNLGISSIVIVGLLAPWLDAWPGSLDGREQGLVARAVMAVGVFGLVVVVLATALQPALRLDSYPVDEVDWLLERDLVADPGVRLAQRDYVGNYLHLRFGEDARVFMDDRFDFHPLESVADHAALLSGGDIEEIIERRRFDVILWESGSALHRWLSDRSDWTIVRVDDEWLIACRVGSAVAARC